MRACLPTTETWRWRSGVARALVALSFARLCVTLVAFGHWRHTLGWSSGNCSASVDELRRLAAHVERAAQLLPFPTKCLPRAMALSWILRRRRIDHAVVVAVRPAAHRGSDDDLHAWVEAKGSKLIGDLPGPWQETLRLGA